MRTRRLQRVLGRCPQLLGLPRKRLEAVERLLRERCLFTAAQLSAVLHACPAVLLREPPALHHHFQYAYFRMGLRHEAMVKGRLFCAPFAELRRRHGFLERLGLYRAPRKGQEHPQNPQLKDILHLPEDAFLASVARATPQEYEVFKKLLAREEEEEEREQEEEEEEEDDDDDVLFAEGDEDLGSEGSRS
ncbi:transcription termination factor 4, mitochondrial [Nothoprocta perdicaria]|uniref:transcription termination factor 4, mitochondrial n=1 Tax=Nothoprocta perdicaria TaxID=30464 RepID=UPI000E1B8694|nr:transcription termination factor 4, mitochondrial [Nothoprocta perdicaria]